MDDDKQKVVNKPLLPLYSASHTLDFVSVGLIFIGLLLMAGFFNSSPGSLIVPFCNMLRSWLGTWAVIFSVMMIVIGFLILLARYVFPRVRLSKPKQILYLILFIIVILNGITLSALHAGREAGGSIGLFFARSMTEGRNPYQTAFWLWVILILALCLMAGGTVWIPRMFRELGREIAELFRRIGSGFRKEEKPEEPGSFDWQAEMRSTDTIQRRTYPEPVTAAAEDEPEDYEDYDVSEDFEEEEIEPVRSVHTVERRTVEPEYIPASYTRKPTMENVKPKTQNSGDAPRSNRLPPLNLLDTEMGYYGQNADHQEFIRQIEEAMEEFGTPVKVIGCSVGPSVIQYQVVPGNIPKNGKVSAKNIRVTQVAQTERDLAVRLGVSNLSIQAPVPGESYIGIDIPNPQAMKVRLRPLLESPEFKRMKTPLAVALGRDITGKPVAVDLASMPHLLVAGTTNSGKSICLRAIAVCLAMNNTPEQLRFVMIDPKRVEFYHFNFRTCWARWRPNTNAPSPCWNGRCRK